MLLLTKISRYCSKQYNFCSIKCTNEAQRNDGILKRNKEKYFENKYGEGIKNPFQAEEAKSKSKETCIERYGVESYRQTEEYQIKTKATKLERYGDENYNNQEKSKQTNIERHGVECALLVRDEDGVEKRAKTWKMMYGNDIINPFQVESVKNKSKKTKNEKYGDENYRNYEQAKETCLQKYGVENYAQTKEFNRKYEDAMSEKYGDGIKMGFKQKK